MLTFQVLHETNHVPLKMSERHVRDASIYIHLISIKSSLHSTCINIQATFHPEIQSGPTVANIVNGNSPEVSPAKQWNRRMAIFIQHVSVPASPWTSTQSRIEFYNLPELSGHGEI